MYSGSILKIFKFILIVSISMFSSGIDVRAVSQKENTNQFPLEQFDLLTELSGWILVDRELFWTSDSGQSWDTISPSIPTGVIVQDVEFIDVDTGWILWTTGNVDGSANFTLARTLDHGKNWNINQVRLFDAGEIEAHSDEASMGWFDSQKGWIAVRQSSSSNFSLGTLFTTSDGGVTWVRSTLPIAGSVHLNNPQIGWAIDQSIGNQIFQTRDGGTSWENIALDLPLNSSAVVYEPFYSNEQGLILTTNLESEDGLKANIYQYSSGNWLLTDQATFDSQSGVIGLSVLDARNFVATIPDTNSILRMRNGELDVLENQDGLSALIVALEMVSLDVGWAKFIDSKCVTDLSFDSEPDAVSCESTTRLLQTTDGGLTWQDVQLPFVAGDVSFRSVTELNLS
jgi:photosystem II stability/assembly factor-like uncharacterized protein